VLWHSWFVYEMIFSVSCAAFSLAQSTVLAPITLTVICHDPSYPAVFVVMIQSVGRLVSASFRRHSLTASVRHPLITPRLYWLSCQVFPVASLPLITPRLYCLNCQVFPVASLPLITPRLYCLSCRVFPVASLPLITPRLYCLSCQVFPVASLTLITPRLYCLSCRVFPVASLTLCNSLPEPDSPRSPSTSVICCKHQKQSFFYQSTSWSSKLAVLCPTSLHTHWIHCWWQSPLQLSTQILRRRSTGRSLSPPLTLSRHHRRSRRHLPLRRNQWPRSHRQSQWRQRPAGHSQPIIRTRLISSCRTSSPWVDHIGIKSFLVQFTVCSPGYLSLCLSYVHRKIICCLCCEMNRIIIQPFFDKFLEFISTITGNKVQISGIKWYQHVLNNDDHTFRLLSKHTVSPCLATLRVCQMKQMPKRQLQHMDWARVAVRHSPSLAQRLQCSARSAVWPFS